MINIFSRIPWQKKLYIFASIITIVPALFISYNIINIAKDELTSSTNSELILTANQLADQLNDFYKTLFEDLRLIKNGLENKSLGQNEKLSFLFAGIQNIDNILSISIMIDDNGSYVNAVEARKDSVNSIPNNQLKNHPALFNFELDRIREAVLQKTTLTKPVYFDDINVWVSTAIIEINLGFSENTYLLAKVNLTNFHSNIENHLFNKNGEIVVINKFGENIFGLQNDLTKQKYINTLTDLLKSGIRISGLNSFEDKNNNRYVTCIAFPENLDWSIIAVIDETAAYTPVDKMMLVLRYWLLIGIAIALIGVVLFSKNISNPIIKMSKIADKIASGFFDVKIDYKARDSIGLLGDSLVSMGDSLKTSFTRIEQQNVELDKYSKTLELQVEERTKQLKETNDDLQKAYLRVLELNEEKNEFLGIAAHDLKNPLIAVKGYGEMLLEDDDLPPDLRQEFAKSIVESSERMFTIIKSLLDVNAIEEGKIKMNLENIDYKMILGNVLSMYYERASNKSIQLHNESAEGEFYINVDMNLLVQVLENIISNAIKFSPQNKNIYTKVYREHNTVYCSVKDEGPGFSEEDKKKLFGKFAKLSARPTAGEHSSGLGLSIVKKLVELMNGKIYVVSEKDKGAEFIIEFPVSEMPDFN